jgi:hypothetical protein
MVGGVRRHPPQQRMRKNIKDLRSVFTLMESAEYLRLFTDFLNVKEIRNGVKSLSLTLPKKPVSSINKLALP